jgi:hypothetical protein
MARKVVPTMLYAMRAINPRCVSKTFNNTALFEVVDTISNVRAIY